LLTPSTSVYSGQKHWRKRRKELAREKEEKIKQEKEFAKTVYRGSLEAEKKVKKEIKKEK
jgi:hypothetical protein